MLSDGLVALFDAGNVVLDGAAPPLEVRSRERASVFALATLAVGLSELSQIVRSDDRGDLARIEVHVHRPGRRTLPQPGQRPELAPRKGRLAGARDRLRRRAGCSARTRGIEGPSSGRRVFDVRRGGRRPPGSRLSLRFRLRRLGRSRRPGVAGRGLLRSRRCRRGAGRLRQLGLVDDVDVGTFLTGRPVLFPCVLLALGDARLFAVARPLVAPRMVSTRRRVLVVAVVGCLGRRRLFLDVVRLVCDELRLWVVLLVGLRVLTHGDAPVFERVLGQDERLLVGFLLFDNGELLRLGRDFGGLFLFGLLSCRRCGYRLVGRLRRRWAFRRALRVFDRFAQCNLKRLLVALGQAARLARQLPELGAIVVHLSHHEPTRAEQEMRAQCGANP